MTQTHCLYCYCSHGPPLIRCNFLRVYSAGLLLLFSHRARAYMKTVMKTIKWKHAISVCAHTRRRGLEKRSYYVAYTLFFAAVNTPTAAVLLVNSLRRSFSRPRPSRFAHAADVVRRNKRRNDKSSPESRGKVCACVRRKGHSICFFSFFLSPGHATRVREIYDRGP